jgi:hypothetical protein
MQTVQRNFASTLIGSGIPKAQQFKAIKKQTHVPVQVDKYANCIVETATYPLEKNPQGGRNVLVASKVVDKGVVEYYIGEVVED